MPIHDRSNDISHTHAHLRARARTYERNTHRSLGKIESSWYLFLFHSKLPISAALYQYSSLLLPPHYDFFYIIDSLYMPFMAKITVVVVFSFIFTLNTKAHSEIRANTHTQSIHLDYLAHTLTPHLFFSYTMSMGVYIVYIIKIEYQYIIHASSLRFVSFFFSVFVSVVCKIH